MEKGPRSTGRGAARGPIRRSPRGADGAEPSLDREAPPACTPTGPATAAGRPSSAARACPRHEAPGSSAPTNLPAVRGRAFGRRSAHPDATHDVRPDPLPDLVQGRAGDRAAVVLH